jgi:hypothetical protein
MKSKKIKILIIILIALFVLYLLSWSLDFSFGQKPTWGATFSELYSEELGLNWKETYSAILNDLNIKKIRLVAYWNRLEPIKGAANFTDLDWQIAETQKKNKEIILAIGFRVPRWPECHIPQWTTNSSKEEFEKTLLTYLETAVNRYKSNPAIKIWQVENEPFLSVFGSCPEPDINLLKKEIALIKSLDPTRPVLITASGELSLGFKEAGLSEIFGTTLYRVVWNKYLGYFKHFTPPAFYALKAFLIKTFFKTKEVVIAELQAEPWSPALKPIAEIPFNEQTENFAAKQLRYNMEFARKTGIKDIYLWGVEWWYWRKIHGDPTFWETGKIFLNTN